MIAEIKLDRILFATDFLGSSRLALDYAVGFAQHFHATIVMLHVVELTQAAREVEAETTGPSLMRRVAMERLEVLATGVRKLGLAVETHVDDGIPSDVILNAVEKFHADLLVLGVHGVHRGLEHLLIGSNTEKILLSAPCPTLTVGAHVMSGVDLQLHFDKILYVSDLTPEVTAAAPYALFLSDAFNAPIEVCQLLPPVAENNQHLQLELADKYCKSMTAALGERHPEWCAPALHLDRGMEVSQLIEHAQRQHAGVIVLGSAISRNLAGIFTPALRTVSSRTRRAPYSLSPARTLPPLGRTHEPSLGLALTRPISRKPFMRLWPAR